VFLVIRILSYQHVSLRYLKVVEWDPRSPHRSKLSSDRNCWALHERYQSWWKRSIKWRLFLSQLSADLFSVMKCFLSSSVDVFVKAPCRWWLQSAVSTAVGLGVRVCAKTFSKTVNLVVYRGKNSLLPMPTTSQVGYVKSSTGFCCMPSQR